MSDEFSPDTQEELRHAILGLAGSMAHAADQAGAMTDRELGELLLSGHYTTIEVHEAASRLSQREERLA